MGNLAAPVGVGEGAGEVIEIRPVGLIQLGAGHDGLGVDGIGAGQVQRHRVKGGEHTHIGDNGQVILGMAVAVGAHVPHQRDVEIGPSVQNRLGVLGNLAVQHGGGLGVGGVDGPHRAGVDAPATAHALRPVDVHDAALQLGAFVGTVLGAGAAANAFFGVHLGAALAVHLPLAGIGAAAHAQVLHGAAEAGFLMALEVVQGNDDIGIHDGPADFGGLYVLAAHHGHIHIVGALQAVGDENMAAGGVGGEAV